MNKLRLVITRDCRLDCFGCCNKSIDWDKVPIERDFAGYDTVIITGGEPMLYPDRVIDVIKQVRVANMRKKPEARAKIIVYTADVSDIDKALLILKHADGMTVTAHNHRQTEIFMLFAQAVYDEYITDKSLRFNSFIDTGFSIFYQQILEAFKLFSKGKIDWVLKKDIEWIADCPLPEGEVLRRYE